MSSKLWEYFIQDDVESFQSFLANVTFAGPRAAGGSGGIAVAAAANLSSKARSPGSTITSSPNPKQKKPVFLPGTSAPERSSFQRGGTTLSRADVNARDNYGRTLLHHIASSSKPTAAKFATALLEIPFVDIYAQDWESGWTALHRALYAGNATVAFELMARDTRDATDFSKAGQTAQIGSLIKIKDREGYSPFDLYGRTLEQSDPPSKPTDDPEDEPHILKDRLENRNWDFFASEVFTLGSNKNLNLGLGDQDDRQFPERISLNRPEHLMETLYHEYHTKLESRGHESVDNNNGPLGPKALTTIVKRRPIRIRNLVMSKLHTAVLTYDQEANLFICGFGPGGRLGTGDEVTRFTFSCIETGGLAGKEVRSVALGQDHTLAVTRGGELFSWGSNKFGQLGYGLPRTGNKNDVSIQTTPRQIFNPFKGEKVLGAAASSIHSVVFTVSGLYTFGKNEGQLGLIGSDARSLDVQIKPRRVGASLFTEDIFMASAIDRATAVLLRSQEVWVFSQYGYSKLSFPLELPRFIGTNYGHQSTSGWAGAACESVNEIVKLTSGGNTICVLTSFGTVFTVEVNKPENSPALTSTTNPSKIRNSLAVPVTAWSAKKSHMAARDVDVGQDGSIIICTSSGSAWRKEKRPKNKEGASKEYKFARIPGLSRAVAVRSNAFGAYAVAQRDCNVTREQIHFSRSRLLMDILPLSPFLLLLPDSYDMTTVLRHGSDEHLMSAAASLKRFILSSPNMDDRFRSIRHEGTVWITNSLYDVRIPVHEFLAKARSPVLRKALEEFRTSNYSTVPNLLDVEEGKDDHVQIQLKGVDALTVINLVFFLYTDGILDVWNKSGSRSENATRYRRVRAEVTRVASQLGLQSLEKAAKNTEEPESWLKHDMNIAINHPSFFDDADVLVQLDGGSVKVHSQLMCQRCPFFDTLFRSSGGQWVKTRQKNSSGLISVDLEHIDRSTFDYVLRYLYADCGPEMFDEVCTDTVDDFIDLLLDVMFVANELMIDRLSEICQKMLGEFVNDRNVSSLVKDTAPVLAKDFQNAALEYMCLQLESMLTNRCLEGLDYELLSQLDNICKNYQFACSKTSRKRNTEAYAFENYPGLDRLIKSDKCRRIDAMALQSRLSQIEPYDVRSRAPAKEKSTASPSARKQRSSISKDVVSLESSPVLKARPSTGDLMFQMDDEAVLSPSDGKGKTAMRGPRFGESDTPSYPDSPALGASIPEGESLERRGFLDQQMSSPPDELLAQSPTAPRSIALGRGNAPSSVRDTPWSSPVISDGKMNLKDIMGETSQSRVSNLTLGMSGKREVSGTATPKLSQKERRKMQQQQLEKKSAAEQKAKEARENPWQLPTSSPSGAQSKLDPLGSKSPGPQSPKPSKPQQKPSMTLRQTVAGTPPSQPRPVTTPVQTQSRSVSANLPLRPSPSPSSGPSAPFQQALAKATPQSSIQSIRHIPPPDANISGSRSPSYGSLSLAAILEQQQTEKDEIREAATAKHNLQDIQAEQEFQQWWDQESRRVQGLIDPEPQQRSGKSARGGKSPGGTPGSSRKRRGNKPSGDDGSGSPAQKQSSSVPSSRSTPKKNANSAAIGPQQTVSTDHANGGQAKNSRRGGSTPRGKGKGRE